MMSKRKILLIIFVVLVISFFARFFTADVILQSYRIPMEQGSNYFEVSNDIYEKHTYLQESFEKSDRHLEMSWDGKSYDFVAVSQHPPSIVISTPKALELMSTFSSSEYQSNAFFMFQKFYLTQEEKYYTTGIMICFVTCGY